MYLVFLTYCKAYNHQWNTLLFLRAPLWTSFWFIGSLCLGSTDEYTSCQSRFHNPIYFSFSHDLFRKWLSSALNVKVLKQVRSGIGKKGLGIGWLVLQPASLALNLMADHIQDNEGGLSVSLRWKFGGAATLSQSSGPTRL